MTSLRRAHRSRAPQMEASSEPNLVGFNLLLQLKSYHWTASYFHTASLVTSNLPDIRRRSCAQQHLPRRRAISAEHWDHAACCSPHHTHTYIPPTLQKTYPPA